MFSNNPVVKELGEKPQKESSREIEVILEILAEAGDGYFFGADKLRKALMIKGIGGKQMLERELIT